MDQRSRELFEHGYGDLASRFDPDVRLVRLEGAEVHDLRDSLWYALCPLLESGKPSPLAEEIIREVLTARERDTRSPYRGNFRWFYEDDTVEDLNAVEFVLERLVHILLRCREQLSAETLAAVHEAMRLGLEQIEWLDVHWSYTNIYLLEVHNCVLGGQLLGDERLIERGRRRLEEWTAATKADGAPNEFNSPTYSAVQILALAAVSQFATDARVRDLSLEMEQFLWRHVASRFHVPTLQLAGPHSRAYRRDVTGAQGFLKVLLYKLLGDERLLAETPYYSGPGREGEIIVALTELNCPPDAMQMLAETTGREVRDWGSRERGLELVTYLTPEFALGTMSRPYYVGEPPEPWPQHNASTLHYRRERLPGYGVLYSRYITNERKVGDLVYPAQRTALDLWEEGLFQAAQSGSDVIVLYGTMPRGLRPVTSLRLDIRMLGPDEESTILTAAGPWDGRETKIPALEPVVVADGDVYIGLLPLEPERLGPDAPLLLRRDGGETVVSIYNYRGPAKVFWEYRSLGGPFFKGNPRNGFVISVAPRSAFGSAEAYREHLATVPLEDETRESVRRVRFGEVTLECDLREMRV